MNIGLALAITALLIAVFNVWSLLHSLKTLRLVYLLICLVYAMSMFGSSLVEEEHHFWYWGTTGWIAWMYILASRKRFKDGVYWIFCMAVIRIIRSWNQTGQKWAGSPDIVQILENPEYSWLLWTLITLYFGSLFDRLWKGSFSKLNGLAGFLSSFMTVASCIIFKVNQAYQSGQNVPEIIQRIVGLTSNDLKEDPSRLITLARLSFFIIAIGILYELSTLILSIDSYKRQPLTNLSYIVEVLFVTQAKTSNIPIFLFFNLLRQLISRAITQSFIFRSKGGFINMDKFIVRIVAITTITTLALQHVSFFAMGNSNSLASVDLSNAYNGLSSYNMEIVGILTFWSNWLGPLYWSLTCLSTLTEDEVWNQRVELYKSSEQLSKQDKAQTYRRSVLALKILITQLFFSAATTGIMGACIALKHHLFIWTVFSPKLLYGFAWVILQHALVDVACTMVLSVLS